MNNTIQLTKDSMLTQFGKYTGVILLNGLLYWCLFMFFIYIANIHYMLSAILTIIISVVATFTVNSQWTWRRQRKNTKSVITLYRFLKYCIVGGVTTVVGLVMFYFYVELWHVPFWLTYVISFVPVVVATFFAHYYWTWGKTEGKELDWTIQILKKTRMVVLLNKLGIES